jgi:hypothetical protein
MRTVRTKVFFFNELTEAAQQKAINDFRNKGIDTFYIYDEAEQTVKAFNELFNLKSGFHSWLEFRTDNIEDEVLNLSGFRLRKYILNNYGYKLFKPAYLKHGKTEETFLNPHPMRRQKTISSGPNKGKVLVSYYSNIKKDNCCVLTGVCYDDDMLNPIYEFLQQPKENICFEELLTECFEAIRKTIENEIEYQESDEAISETIEANEYEFTEEGNIF